MPHHTAPHTPTPSLLRQAIHDNLQEAFAHSETPMHLCWFPGLAVRDVARIDLGGALGQVSGDSALGRSLVIVSPKHMGFDNDDAGLSSLPVDPLSLYVFHDVAPRRFDGLRQQGRALEWRVYGPDGNFPFADSLLFTRSSLTPAGVEGARCVDFICADPPSRTYVSPWATPLSPQKILDTQSAKGTMLRSTAPDAAAPDWVGDRGDVVHFIGSVWRGNAHAFRQFAEGCGRSGVSVIRHGPKPLPASMRRLVLADDVRAVPSDERDRLVQQGVFAVAVQGSLHLRGSQSYIADRALLAASLGMVVATNNEAVVRFLSNHSESVAFHPNASDVCAAGLERAAMRHKAADGGHAASHDLAGFMLDHTYAARLADMAAMALDARPTPPAQWLLPLPPPLRSLAGSFSAWTARPRVSAVRLQGQDVTPPLREPPVPRSAFAMPRQLSESDPDAEAFEGTANTSACATVSVTLTDVSLTSDDSISALVGTIGNISQSIIEFLETQSSSNATTTDTNRGHRHQQTQPAVLTATAAGTKPASRRGSLMTGTKKT